MRVLLGLLTVAVACTCNGKSTQQLLDGDALTDAKTSIKLTVPASGALISAESNLIFGWQEKENINKYQIEISDRSDFSNIILSKTTDSNSYSYNSADLKAGVVLESSGLFWRVKVPYVKNNLQSDSYVANYIVAGIYYVDCAYTGNTSVGTKTAPLKTIQGGLDAALISRQGISTATAEVRVSKGTCNESILLRGNVALKGGYDSSQNWIRNPKLYSTTISTTDIYTIQGQPDLVATFTNTLVEGFRIISTMTGSNVLPAVSLTSAKVTFRNNFMSQTSATSNTGIGLGNIYASAGSTTLDSNVMSAVSSATSGYVSNLQFAHGSVTANNNVLFLSVPSGASMHSLFGAANSSTIVVNLTNNTIFLASTGSSNAIGLAVDSSGGFSGSFERNLIFQFVPAGSSRCGQQSNSNSKFGTMRNNALVDCGGNANGVWFAGGSLDTSYAAPWTAAISAAGPGAALDVAGALLTSVTATSPIGCASSCTSLQSGNRGGNTVPGTPTLPGNPNVIFQGYVANDPTTFTFKPNAIADMDNDGIYTASIDAGANTSTAGLLNQTTN